MVYYRLQMVDKDGKFTFSKVEKVQQQIGKGIAVYPNPAKAFVYIEGSNMVEISLTDNIGGLLLYKKIASSNIYSLNISSLGKGIYLLRVKDSKGEVKMAKVVAD